MEIKELPLGSNKDWQIVLHWANQYKYCFYSSGDQLNAYPYGSFPQEIAIGEELINLPENNVFDSLDKHLKSHPEKLLYGYLAYDLFEETHQLKSKHESTILWPSALFFEAHSLISLEGNKLIIKSDQAESIALEIELYLKNQSAVPTNLGKVENLTCNTSKEEYIQTVNRLKSHIEEGDVYEINYCINNTGKCIDFNPLVAFERLNRKSPTPFGTYLKCAEKYIICASPERFIKLSGHKIISQPIKGTAKRDEDPLKDIKLKEQLFHSEKERAENMMIVDLVRNDLAQSAVAGSVQVEELFGIYSFKYVHQMISTITAEKKEGVSNVSIIKNAFPMGSMTGAPKKSAIQLIEHYEKTKRNVFSGTIGHFRGDKSFDFNVVIRSIFYDDHSKMLNYQIGSAITYDAQAEDEYKECMLKAQAIEELLVG